MRLRRADEDLAPVLEDLRRISIGAIADRDRVALAISSSDVGIIVVDEQGREVVRSLGAERFRDARHSDVLAQDVINRLLAVALEGGEVEEELALFGPPRETLIVHALPLRDSEFAILGAAAYVRDVSELRRIESVRRDFVANVSHELKTPIGAMGLLAETFEACDDPATGRRLAGQLRREAERLARIVDDLLDLSRAEAQDQMVKVRTTVAEVITDALARVEAQAIARDIPLVVAPVDPGLIVTGDSRQLVGAVTNLLDNAVKYSEAGAPVELEATAQAGRLTVSVRDRGIGIPSRDLERVFERFYRVDKARSRATGGTGLGLAIVRHVAHAHGGEVLVTSTEGEGSTFRLVLPLADPSVEAA